MSYEVRRGVGQVSSALLALPVGGTSSATPATPLTGCAAGASSACGWFDDIYASQGCLNWYAQCDPSNAFYLTNTQGLIVGGASVLGSTAGDAIAAAGNSALGFDSGTIPNWAWLVGIGALALFVIPKLVGK